MKIKYFDLISYDNICIKLLNEREEKTIDLIIFDYENFNKIKLNKDEIDIFNNAIYLIQHKFTNEWYIGQTTQGLTRLSSNHPYIQNLNEYVIYYISLFNDRIYKDHLDYFENKLIEIFKKNNFLIKNETNGNKIRLKNERDLKYLNKELKTIISLLKFKIEIENNEINQSVNDEKNNNHYFKNENEIINVFCKIPNSTKVIEGSFNLKNKKITVFKNQIIDSNIRTSLRSIEEIESILNNIKKSEKLNINYNKDEKKYVVEYLEDYEHNSPSQASSLVVGGTSNGWTSWIIKENNKTIDIYRNKI